MKKWDIQYWSAGKNTGPVEKWLDSLTKDQFTSIAKEISMLRQIGNMLKLPHSKAIGQGLFELREKRYGYRIYYCFQNNNIIILLAAGDKKSQEKDIKTAYKRKESL